MFGRTINAPPPLQVHPKFRLIVHLPTAMRAPAPFYNRFEKYLVTVKNMWEELLSDGRLKDAERTSLKQVLPLWRWRRCCVALVQFLVLCACACADPVRGGEVGVGAPEGGGHDWVGGGLHPVFRHAVKDAGACGPPARHSPVAGASRATARAYCIRAQRVCVCQALVTVLSSTDKSGVEEWARHGMGREGKQQEAEALLAAGSFSHDKFVLEVAASMLQLATPEAVLEAYTGLPAALTTTYLNSQVGRLCVCARLRECVGVCCVVGPGPPRLQEHFELPKVVMDTSSAAASDLGDEEDTGRSGTADQVRGVDLKRALDVTLYRCAVSVFWVRKLCRLLMVCCMFLCPSPLKKTVAFTRLSEGLGIADTTARGSTTLAHPSYNGNLVAVMNFAEVNTQQYCEAYLKEFCDPGECLHSPSGW